MKKTKSSKPIRYDYIINGEPVGAFYLSVPKNNEEKISEFFSYFFLNEDFANLLGFKHIKPSTSGCFLSAESVD